MNKIILEIRGGAVALLQNLTEHPIELRDYDMGSHADTLSTQEQDELGLLSDDMGLYEEIILNANYEAERPL